MSAVPNRAVPRKCSPSEANRDAAIAGRSSKAELHQPWSPAPHGPRADGNQPIRPWHCLNFLPEPQGQGALRGTLPYGLSRARSGDTGSLDGGDTALLAVMPGARSDLTRQWPQPRRTAADGALWSVAGSHGPGAGRPSALLGRQADFEMREHLRHRLAQPAQQRIEEREGFLLVLVQGVALAVAAQDGCPGADGRAAADALSRGGRGSAGAGSSRPCGSSAAP